MDRLKCGHIGGLGQSEIWDVITEFFPRGLFGFYLWDQDKIRKSFGKSEAEFAYEALWAGSRFEFLEYFQKFLTDDVWAQLHNLLLVSMIIFGNEDVHGEPAQRLFDMYEDRKRDRYPPRYIVPLQQSFEIAAFLTNGRLLQKWLLAEVDKLNLLLSNSGGAVSPRGILVRIAASDRLLKIVNDLRRYAEEN